jgi:hypothetical protein
MMRSSYAGILLASAGVAVAASIIMGIAILGSPRAQRQQRLDALRIEDLQRMQQLIAGYSRVHRRLPENLGVLAQEPGFTLPTADPESGPPYVYEAMSRDTFRLCATFHTSSGRPGTGTALDGGMWAHPSGRRCFVRHADVPSAQSP